MYPMNSTTPTNRLPRVAAEPQSPMATAGRMAGNALVSAFALAIAFKVVDVVVSSITKPKAAPQPQRHPEPVTA